MKVKANGITMNYELSGSGRCFTLIHGSGDNLNAWYNQVPVFAQRYKLLTYDVRGHGETEMPEAELTTGLWVQDLYELLKALSINETILLGYSMGASIALEFTLTHPKMVKALILSNGGGTPRRSEAEMHEMEARRKVQLEAMEKDGMESVFRDRVGRMFSPGFAEKNPQTMERYRTILLKNDPKKYLRVMQRVVRPTTPPDLSKITCPTLIIAGEHDAFGGPETARGIQQAIRGAQLKVFSTGHPTAMEQPKEYSDTVLKFLTEAGLS